MGGLSRDQKQVRGVLSKYDLLIVLGADPVRMSVWSEVEPLPDGMAVVHIGLVDWDMGKNFAAEMAVRADLRETLLALTPVLAKLGGDRLAAEGEGGARRAREEQLDGQARRARRHASRAAAGDADRSGLAHPADRQRAAARRGGGQRGPHLRRAYLTDLIPYRDRYGFHALAVGRHRLGLAGGGRRGARPGAAPGVLLLRRRQRHVLDPGAVDGGAPQAADHLRDRQQRRLSHHQAAPACPSTATSNFIGMDFVDPKIDFAALAKSLGMPAEHITEPDAVGPALRRAFSTPGPKLLDVVVDGKV